MIPLGKIRVAGHDGECAFVACRADPRPVVEQRLESKIIDDEQRQAGQRCQFALVGTCCADAVQGGNQLRAAGEHNVYTAADGAMSERQCEMALADADLLTMRTGACSPMYRAITGLERIEDAGEAQLLQHRP